MMSRTVVTANLLEEQRRQGREIVVPRDALLTPAARDWIREHAHPVTWTDGRSSQGGGGGETAASLGVAGDLSQPALRSLRIELERIAGNLEEVPESNTDRRKWLEHRLGRFVSVADSYRDKLVELYGEEHGSQVKYAEAFEGCEYGGSLDGNAIGRLLPFFEA